MGNIAKVKSKQEVINYLKGRGSPYCSKVEYKGRIFQCNVFNGKTESAAKKYLEEELQTRKLEDWEVHYLNGIEKAHKEAY